MSHTILKLITIYKVSQQKQKVENSDLELPLTLDNYVILHNVLCVSGLGCSMCEKEVILNIKGQL